MPTITIEQVEAVRSLSPKRFRFLDNPAVREHKARGHHTVGLKFDSLSRLFSNDTGITTLNGPYGPYKFLTDQAQIEAALAWQSAHERFIFLRDNLYCSIALDLNLAEAGIYTELGQAEHDAKASRKESAITLLAKSCKDAICQVSGLRACDIVCAVPPSPDKDWDLPTEIVERVAISMGMANYSKLIAFAGNKKSLKSLSLSEKWNSLDQVGLNISDDFKGKKVILIDDKYQSGTTAQFVASKMYAAGASEIHGLFCVKTWRDTDNT